MELTLFREGIIQELTSSSGVGRFWVGERTTHAPRQGRRMRIAVWRCVLARAERGASRGTISVGTT